MATIIALECAGNYHPLDLVGPLIDLSDLCIPHHALHRELLDVPVPAEDLHRLGAGPHGHIAAVALGHGTEPDELGAKTAHILGLFLEEGAGLVEKVASRLRLHGHV